jgi:hypothetical protein
LKLTEKYNYRRRFWKSWIFEFGQAVELEIEKKSLRVSLTRAERLKRAQALVRKYVDPEISLADEMIEDRRREAEND